MMRILFVDDEPKMLRALRRMLSQKRKDWGMSFVDSGQAALELLEKEKYDIVVTDMRMPGMSGDILLAKVKEEYPEMTRIILSGQSNQEAVLKTVRLAHQYLAKPYGADELISTLSKAARFRSSVGNQAMSKLISKIEMLPSPSSRYHELIENLESEEISLRRIGHLISEDMGLSSNILRIVNSAFFSLPRRVADVVDAVVFLGLDIIKGLILTHHLFSVFDFTKLPDLSYEMLWEHSINTACMGRAIIKSEINDVSVTDDTFIAGLMHDVGKLVLGYVMREEYDEIIKQAMTQNRRLWKVETERLGFSHAEVGAYLVGLWGLPEDMVETIQNHHHPGESDNQKLLMLSVIHVANVLEHQLCVINCDYEPPQFSEEYLIENNFIEKVDSWRNICEERLDSDKGDDHGRKG